LELEANVIRCIQ